MDSDVGQCWHCRKTGKFHCESCNFAFYCSKRCQQMDRFRHEVECIIAMKRKTCSACGKIRSSDLQRCSSCFQEYYCDKSCQLSHWPAHKYTCKEFKETVLSHAKIPCLKPADLPWYIGQSISQDYLRLHQNEKIHTDHELRLLFVGAGDLRDVVRTVVDLPSSFNGQLTFVLNDIGPHVSARNLLFLYCAITDPTSFEHLVHIWYSLYLTPATLKFLVGRLKELITDTCEKALENMRHLITIPVDHWSHCLQIWQGWYKLALDADAAERMMEIRRKKFSQYSPILGMGCLFQTIPQQHVPSMKDFMQNGLLLPLSSPQRRDALFPNCTMACYNPRHPKYANAYVDISQPAIVAELSEWQNILTRDEEMIYGVRDDAYVFSCWDYLIVKEAVGMNDDVLDMYLSYLKRIFRTFTEKLLTGTVNFQFIIDDFQNINQYLSSGETFDRISVSNLGDHYFFPLLLKQFGPFLNKNNNCSVLISHHENWPKLTQVYDNLQHGPLDAMKRAKKDALIRKEMLPGVADKQTVIGFLCCHEDYFDSTPFLMQSLIRESVAYCIQHENIKPSKHLIERPATTALKMGLQLRDFCVELNRVVPFTQEGNVRRVSVQMNNKRYLEWTAI